MFGFVSCATEVYDYGSKEAHGKIATDISVEQVKATGNENLSRGESKAPAMRTFKVEGAKGDMFLRYTAAAGISGKEFDTSAGNESRGKMITTDNFYDDYGLFMYEYPNTDTWTNSSVSSLALPAVVNERVLKATGWETNEIWPGMGARLALYGYAPYNAAGVSALPTATTTGKPTFHYIVPTEAIDQKDLLVSEDDQYVSPSNIDGGVDVPGDYNAIKTLKFKHACTAVRIAVGDQMAPCSITKIAIKGVYGEADYNYGAGTNLNEGAWENYSPTLSNYTLTADLTVSATDQNKVINDGKYTFMLLPQIVPDNALLEIVLDDGEEHILTANIGGSNWEMGYSVTYFITTASVDEENVLLVETSNDPISMLGESRTINIKSYRQTFYGSQVPIPWTLSYNYNEDYYGQSPWLSSTNDIVSGLSFSGTGGSTGENTTFQVARQVERSKTWRSTHTATLRAAAEQGTESSPVDLSAGKQTANCYVVSAPGYYKLPLVYGNARNADGSANTASYYSSTFVDHNGVHITSPYIYETNGGANIPYEAILVWQDAPHLITPNSVKLSDDKHYIEFQVEQKNICQGNSVLAVCDTNGKIMWSWHIWVTDHDMINTIEVRNNSSAGGLVVSHFMEVPLGFCDKEVRVRDERTFNIKIVQLEAGGKNATLTFNQITADSLCTYGNNVPYYQWGRKDPMLPSDGTTDCIDKYYYDNNRVWNIRNNSVTIGNAIQNPFTFYAINNGDWSTTHKYDLWNKNFTSAATVNNTAIVKTVYDPSVSGFCLPRTAVFTGFTTTGGNSAISSEFNVSGEIIWGEGWNFLTGISGGTILLNTTGYRTTYNSGTGSLVAVDSYGTFWVAGALSDIYARRFNYYYENIKPQSSFPRSCGEAVQPVTE